MVEPAPVSPVVEAAADAPLEPPVVAPPIGPASDLPPGIYEVRPDGSIRIHNKPMWMPPTESLRELKETAIAYMAGAGRGESRDSHWRHGLALVVLIVVAALTLASKLDGSATGAILGAVVGYVLGQKEGGK